MKGKKVTISGSGNVAQFAAEKCLHFGATVLTLSDSNGTIYEVFILISYNLLSVGAHQYPINGREVLDSPTDSMLPNSPKLLQSRKVEAGVKIT